MCGLKQACGTFCCCEVYLSCVLAVWLSVCVDPLLKTSFGCSSEWQCVTSVIFCKLLFSRLLSLCRQTRWELVLLLPVVVVVIIKAFLNHTRTFIKCVKDIYLTHSVLHSLSVRRLLTLRHSVSPWCVSGLFSGSGSTIRGHLGGD